MKTLINNLAPYKLETAAITSGSGLGLIDFLASNSEIITQGHYTSLFLLWLILQNASSKKNLLKNIEALWKKIDRLSSRIDNLADKPKKG